MLLPATAIFAAFATSALAQDVTRTDWRMNRTSEIVTVPGVVSPANGDPLAFVYAPPIPDANAPGWEPAPDPQIIAFKGHNGDEISRLAEGTCLQAFDFVFFDTVVTVSEGAQVSDFSISFIGMDDGSRITIFNEAYPTGTPDMPDGVNNFVAYNQNVTLDMAQFLRTGQNRVVITQVDDCPSGNKLRAADVVLNGSVIAAPQTGTPEPAPKAGADGMMDVAYGDVHARSMDGLRFDFQVPGDFVVAGTADSRFVLHKRNEISATNPAVTVSVAAAAFINGDMIEIYFDDDKVLLNGAVLDLGLARSSGFRTYYLPQGGSMDVTVRSNETVYMIYRYPEGDSLYNSAAPEAFRIKDPSKVVAGFAGVRTGTRGPAAIGLVGIEDGDRSNDLTLRSGEVIALPTSQDEVDRFGESWRVTAEENLFGHRPPAPLAPPPAPVVMADLPEETRTTAATTCLQASVTEVNLLRDCTYDVALTGDPAFADVAAKVQASDAAVPDLPPAQSADGSNPVDDIGQAALAAAQAAAGVQIVLPEATPEPEAAPEATPEPEAEPVAEPEPVPEALGEGIAVVVTREQRFAMDGYYLVFQADGNLCIYTEADNRFIWCVNNDPSIRYADTAEVVMTTGGQLMGLDAAGGVLYAYPPEPTGMPSDIFISSEGKVTMANETGTIWEFN